MTKPYWEGQRVRLRAIEPEDAAYHVDLNRQRWVDRNQEQVHVPSSLARVQRWAHDAALEGYKDGDAFLFEIESLETGELVGSIDTHHMDARVGVLSYGIAIRDGHRQKGYASEAICLVLRYYFLERRYQKANIGVFSFNESSIILHERLGFTLEGRQRRSTYTAGQYHDLLLYGITVEEFRERYPEYLYGVNDSR
ncbi:MAG TPA: GNAT family protein [Thermomicrobiales bacterium]|nr:GNAT family protein [Thermomicrobiales bacterium]